MKKKLFTSFLVVVMVFSTLLVGCGPKAEISDESYGDQLVENETPNTNEPNDEQVENNDGPPPKEYTVPVDDTQYVRDGKFYLDELFVFDFLKTLSGGIGYVSYGFKGRLRDTAIEQLAEYKVSDDIHNDKIEQCVAGIVEYFRVISHEDISGLENGDIVVLEPVINQKELDELYTYIDGIEVVLDDTYTVTVEWSTD